MLLLRQLDALLRGNATDPELLRRGAMELKLRRFTALSLVLGAVYGFFMGWYAFWTRDTQGVEQMIASTVKLPMLFLLTLAVSFPSLYVFSALTGCRLSFLAVLRLLVATITVNLAIAASFGPILGFFTLSTTSYPFMVLLNVVLLATAGFVSLGFLVRTLRGLSQSVEPVRPTPPLPQGEVGAEDAEGGRGIVGRSFSGRPVDRRWSSSQPVAATRESGSAVFGVWIVIYGLVGAQMGWILRPFIGNPNIAFAWFRAREGNFFQSVWAQLSHLVGG